MTPDRYCECLAALRCTRRGMARYLGIDARSARRYVAGDRAIPETLENWLELLVHAPDWRDILLVHPYPDNWKAVQDHGEWEWIDGDDEDDDADAAHEEADASA
jgi:hypothetical protein